MLILTKFANFWTWKRIWRKQAKIKIPEILAIFPPIKDSNSLPINFIFLVNRYHHGCFDFVFGYKKAGKFEFARAILIHDQKTIKGNDEASGKGFIFVMF